MAGHGTPAVAAALLLVKFIHNVVLTMNSLGHGHARDEAEAFARLCGTEHRCSADLPGIRSA